MIYLDNASTSWPKPEAVYQAVDAWLRQAGGSPGRGGHNRARAANRLLFDAREELAALFGIKDSGGISFTCNATEAMNIALFGLLGPGDRVVTTSMEHNAVARPLRALESLGVALEIVSCEPAGGLPLDDLQAALASGAKAVVVSHGSNVTGTLAPLEEIGRLAACAGAVLIVDAAQTAGIEDIAVGPMGIGMLAFSGHKGLLGPQGTGGLYRRDDVELRPLRYGGTGSASESDRQPAFYPDRLESGTPNTPGIAGLLAGARFIRTTGQQRIRAKEQALTKALLAGLKTIPGLKIYGPEADEPRSAVVSVTVDGLDGGEIAFRLDREFGIACRAGLHCAPWAHRTIGTIAAGTVRFSPGYFTLESEIEATVTAMRLIVDEGGKA